MDEPLGALDALTRARLQDELLRIVARTQSTVVMALGPTAVPEGGNVS